MEFPTRFQIWQGAVLHTIVHAIAITSHPILSYEVGWDGLNYLRNDTMGTRGVITFHGKVLVGAFSNIKSKRHISHQGKSVKWREYFKDASDDVLNLATEETSQYLLEEYENNIQPAITTAFWCDDTDIYCKDDWLTFLEHGGHLIKIECLELSQALNEHQENWELNEAQIKLAYRLYLRKISEKETVITNDEYKVLISRGIDGLLEAKALLKKIGFEISL